MGCISAVVTGMKVCILQETNVQFSVGLCCIYKKLGINTTPLFVRSSPMNNTAATT